VIRTLKVKSPVPFRNAVRELRRGRRSMVGRLSLFVNDNYTSPVCCLIENCYQFLPPCKGVFCVRLP